MRPVYCNLPIKKFLNRELVHRYQANKYMDLNLFLCPSKTLT